MNCIDSNMFCLQCKPHRKMRKDDMVCYQTEDTAVEPTEPLKLKHKMFCIRCKPHRKIRKDDGSLCKPYRKIRKNDGCCCQTENVAVAPDGEPDENPGEPDENTDEDPLEPGCYHLYKYKVKKTGVILISKEKDRKKAYEEFLRTKRW